MSGALGEAIGQNLIAKDSTEGLTPRNDYEEDIDKGHCWGVAGHRLLSR
jgi:hypothetical protein